MEGTWKSIAQWESITNRFDAVAAYGRQGEATVFLHERRCPGKPARLVVLEIAGSAQTFYSYVIAPGGFTGTPRVLSDTCHAEAARFGWCKHYDFGLPRPVSKRMYAGQIDPNNDAKFTIRLAYGDVEYTVQCELLPNDTVRITSPDEATVHTAFEQREKRHELLKLQSYHKQ